MRGRPISASFYSDAVTIRQVPSRQFRRPASQRAIPVCYGGRVSGSLLGDAFAHHAWATLRLIDACLALSAEQLGTAVPGTYGSLLQTGRHLVGADSWYLFTMTGERT